MTIQRVLRYFDKDTEKVVGEVKIADYDLEKLKILFNVNTLDKNMINCYPVTTQQQGDYINNLNIPNFDLKILNDYNCFIEVDSL